MESVTRDRHRRTRSVPDRDLDAQHTERLAGEGARVVIGDLDEQLATRDQRRRSGSVGRLALEGGSALPGCLQSLSDGRVQRRRRADGRQTPDAAMANVAVCGLSPYCSQRYFCSLCLRTRVEM